MTSTFIGRGARGGKIHNCWDNSVSDCNGSAQIKVPNYRKVRIDKKTPDSAFCRKCFPHGNPLNNQEGTHGN